MRVYKNVALITAIILVALLAPGGCGVKTQTEPTPAVFASTPAGIACIEMMKKLPRCHSSLDFWDVKTLRSDPELAEMYRVFYDRRVDYITEPFGIDSDSIDYLAHVEGITLVKGNFDLDTIRGNIPTDFARDTDYEDLEVWRGPLALEPQVSSGSVILAEGLFIWGLNRSTLDRLLPVYEGEEPSMYDEKATEMLERLPEALNIGIGRHAGLEGLIISARVIVKEEAGAYRCIHLYKFESPEYAACADVEEFFQRREDEFEEVNNFYAGRGEPCPLHSFTLEQDGEFVEYSVIVEEEYMIALLFYG